MFETVYFEAGVQRVALKCGRGQGSVSVSPKAIFENLSDPKISLLEISLHGVSVKIYCG